MQFQFKNRRLIPAVLVALFFMSHTVQAQQQIGYVNTDTILANMPEYNGIDQQLRQLSEEWRNELDRMQQEIEQLKEEFAAREILFTDEVRQQREEEINQRIEERQQYLEDKFGPEGEYFQEQQSLLEPIQREVFEAINVVAERNGYDFVFDRSGDTGMLYFQDEWNLNDEVLSELGVSPNGASNLEN